MCIYIYIYEIIFEHMSIYILMFICVCMYIYIYLYTLMFKEIFFIPHMCVCVYIYIYIISEIDVCESNPCKYSVNCTQDGGKYICHCEPGYTGLNCDIGQYDFYSGNIIS